LKYHSGMMEEGVDMGLEGMLLIEWMKEWGEKNRK
jgi:hypothetical protein